MPVTALLRQQGETDNAAGTTPSAYAASFASMKAKVAAEIDASWFVARSTYTPGGATNAVIRAAQIVDGSAVFAGPDTDSLGSGYRYDDQHWNETGNASAAAHWTNAVSAVL